LNAAVKPGSSLSKNKVVSAPLERKKLTQQIYDELERQIMTGSLSPGSKLSESEVAEVFGVSRSPVREAIIELERMGFATRTGPRDRIVAKPTVESIRDFFETWWILDVGRIYQASVQADEGDHVLLRNVITDLECALDSDEGSRVSELLEKFHRILYGRAQNRLLDRIAAENGKYLKWLTQLYLANYEDSPIWREEHRAIAAAFIDRDLPGLVDSLRRHILRQGEQIIQGLKFLED